MTENHDAQDARDAPGERDAALLAELADVLRPATQPPPEVLEASRQLFTWRTVDAELAALAYDSLLDDAGAALVRSAGQPRILSFEAGSITIEVEVDETPGARRLLGQLVPAAAAELQLVLVAGEPVPGRADDLGRFVLPLPAVPSRMSLQCVVAGGGVVRSAWLVL